MQPEAKKLGVLLIEAGMITAAQLQDTLRHQKLTGERLGSMLVSLGIINEDSLMDFLAKQTGVPRLDVRNLDIQLSILQKIPRRMAEQMTILPVAFKEPKSMVLAMADPMDLNAVDSARFASGLNIEPVVAGHTSLKQAIADQYNRLSAPPLRPVPRELAGPPGPRESLPVPLDLMVTPFEPSVPSPSQRRDHPRDPFFDQPAPEVTGPFSFFGDGKGVPEPAAEGEAQSQPGVIYSRSAMAETVRPLEEYGTRALVLGMVKMLQRRGIFGTDELQRLIANMVEAREIDPEK